MSQPTPPVPPDPAFRQQFGRSRGLLLGPAAVAAAIAIWVGAVQLGGSPLSSTPRPEVSPAVAVASGPPSASASVAASQQPTLPPPVLQLFGPAPPGSVLIRDHRLREVDLATGAVSDAIGEIGYLDRMLALPAGGYVCVCVRQRTRGEERSNEVDIDVVHRDGATVATVNAGTWVGTDLPGLHQEPGPFSLDAAHSTDGRFLALTTSLRRPPDWSRQAVLVDLAAARVIATVELPSTPPAASSAAGSADPGAGPGAGPRWAWAPMPRFSPDGTKLLLTGVERDELDGPANHRTWVLALDAGRPTGLLALERDDGPARDACGDAFPEFASNDLIVTLCSGDPYSGPFLRRDRPDGSRARRMSLRDALKDSAAPFLVTDGRGTVWLWDSWSTRAFRIDAEAGVVTAAAAIRDRGTPWRFLFPPAVLSPDGRRLIVGVTEGEDAAGRIHVLDAVSLDRVGELATEPGLMTLGMSSDGKWLHLGHVPALNEAGGVEAPARITVLDLETGALRARLGQVGDGAFTIVGRASPAD